MRRMISVLLVLTLLLGFAVPVMATEPEKSDDIVILYTNDVHTYIDGALSYDVIAAMKQELQEDYNHVLLVDAGDHIQGTAYGSMDKGKTIIDLMNAAGYDLATLGNHEFDYGMEGRINVTDVWAEYPYVSCNFYYEQAGIRGENVLDSYRIFNCGDVDIALVGITTPSTFTSTTPAYFQDENGNYIYGIAGGEDGSALYADVQGAIDAATDEGAEIVIALGHLGVELDGDPWGSEATIANVTGLDAFIDGHSHTVMEGETVPDQDGNPVLLTQTGQYFDRIGMMVIDAETGAIETDLIEYDEAAGTLSSNLYPGTQVPSDSAVGEIKGAWMTAVNDLLGTKIGTAEITLDNYDENGNRLVRSQETNSGDFSADALYYLFDAMGMDVDFAVMNGGGVRNGPITGDLSYLSCKEIHTFGNVACLLTVTGQQMLDALEWGARSVGAGEEGSFLHVSGLKYKIDTSIPDTTRQDDKGVWTGAPDAYRVYDVMVYNKETDGWDPLELSKEYNLAGYNYTLRDLGGGFAMFDGAVNVLDYVMEDYMVLANYVGAFEDSTVQADNSPLLKKYPGFLLDYGNLYGSGRICSDLDGDHYCDGCWELLTDCLDGDHDHICDLCGEMPLFVDEDASDGWSCSVCGKAALNLNPKYIALSYRADEDGNVFASGTLLLTTEVLYGEEIPTGTVTAQWGEYLLSEELHEGIAEFTFTDIPMGDLSDCDLAYIPAEDTNFLPDRGRKDIENDAPLMDVYTEYECTINGIPTNQLWLLPGTEVQVVVDMEGVCGVAFDAELGAEPEDAVTEDTVTTFTMPDGSVYMEAFACHCEGYTDILTDAWYHRAVDYALGEGLMIGTGEGVFAPAASTNRAMLVTVLWRLEGEPQPETTGSFTDVERGSWYEQAVEWAAANGIVLGVGDGKFAPDGDLTREQAAVILYRYGVYREGDTSDSASLTEFPDGDEVSAWAQDAMAWSVFNGLIIGEPRGEELYLNPADGCNRAEMATLLMRFAEMVAFW